MKHSTKEALLKEIDRIIKVLRRYPDYDYVNMFVCTTANTGIEGNVIRSMVRRHIGSSHTLNGFLMDQLGVDRFPTKLANDYRILMLKNMKKMVREEYK